MPTNRTRKEIRDYYDDVGWKKDQATGRYVGEVAHEDLDETAQRYMQSNEMRYEIHFRKGGHFFLDAGCGAEPRRKMSENFHKHVCADISILALKEARKQIGNCGLFVVADVASLPFKDGVFDGVLASHCLYHVEKELQPKVLGELYRVTRPNKNILVFYASHYNLISLVHRAARAMMKLACLLPKVSTERNSHTPKRNIPRIYYYTHNPVQLCKDFSSVDVTCLRTLTLWETKGFRKLGLLKPVVALLSILEKNFGHAMLHVGKYVAIRIQKTR